jgi:hypothetical protein
MSVPLFPIFLMLKTAPRFSALLASLLLLVSLPLLASLLLLAFVMVFAFLL